MIYLGRYSRSHLPRRLGTGMGSAKTIRGEETAQGPRAEPFIPARVVVDLFLPSMPAQADHPVVGKRSASRRVNIISLWFQAATYRTRPRTGRAKSS